MNTSQDSQQMPFIQPLDMDLTEVGKWIPYKWFPCNRMRNQIFRSNGLNFCSSFLWHFGVSQSELFAPWPTATVFDKKKAAPPSPLPEQKFLSNPLNFPRQCRNRINCTWVDFNQNTFPFAKLLIQNFCSSSQLRKYVAAQVFASIGWGG